MFTRFALMHLQVGYGSLGVSMNEIPRMVVSIKAAAAATSLPIPLSAVPSNSPKQANLGATAEGRGGEARGKILYSLKVFFTVCRMAGARSRFWSQQTYLSPKRSVVCLCTLTAGPNTLGRKVGYEHV